MQFWSYKTATYAETKRMVHSIITIFYVENKASDSWKDVGVPQLLVKGMEIWQVNSDK